MGRQQFVLFAVLTLLPCLLLGQTYSFQKYGLADGLPQSQITSLAQDREGYIWAGTQGGLVRFNGERFTTYLSQDGLPSSRIGRMLVDGRGTLWIATQRGLARWQDHRLAAIMDQAVAKKQCRAICEDRLGGIWVGTLAGLARKTDGGFVAVPDERGRALGMVYDLIPEGDGVIGVSVRGLFRAGRATAAVAVPGPPAPENSLRAIVRASDGLWVSSTQAGLFLFRDGRWDQVPVGLVKARTVYWMVQATSGTLYIASRDAGLLRRLPGHVDFETFTETNGLPSSVINCALEDALGDLWIGTDIGGLVRLRSEAVINFGKKDGLPDDCVFAITPAAAPGEAWLATMNGAVRCRLGPRLEVLERLTSQEGLADNRVWKVVQAPGGDVWAMTDNAFYRRAPGQSRFVVLPKDLALPRQEVYGLTLDRQGRMWFNGTDMAACLAVRDAEGRWRSWNHTAEGNQIVHCRGVAPRGAGGVWAAADGRILWSDGQALHELAERLPIVPGTVIDVVYEDGRGRLWAGTDGGLIVRDGPSSWRSIRPDTAENFSQVYFIGGDRSGTVWAGISNGALRITPEGRVESFTLEDGLAGLETNQDGFYEDPSGAIWIGTIDGVSRIDPERLRSRLAAPPVIVEATELPGRTIRFPNDLDLSWTERTATFRVAVLSYSGHRGGLCRARLVGMEEDWTVSRSGAGLRYTNIPPGRYSFEVEAAIESGGWGRASAIPVLVHRPFWLTWWFRLALLLLVGGAAVGIFLWRTRILRERAQRLENIVAERTEELVAANEELARLATHDPLTGLWNRRAILDELAAACQAPAGSDRRPFGVILVDIDDFKKVNDRLGHVAGDFVLQEVARQIEAQTRQKDSVGRYGGDEFLVILDGADAAAVETVARRIAAASYSSRVEERLVMVTASCGALTLLEDGPLNEVAVLSRVDELLYETKKTGKRGFLIDSLRTSSGRRT